MKTYIFPWKTFIWVTIFAIAMGFLESAVVIYMRALLYPQGFAFPMVIIPTSLAMTELLREAATLVMLLVIGILAGRSIVSRFAWFLYSFAIWDIFYYVFLKVLLNWPESFMTWDVLFLIPTVWVGPVITPVIVSLTMILLAIVLVFFDSKNGKANLNAKEWLLLILGSIALILSFIWDYSEFLLAHYRFTELWSVPSNELMKLSCQYIPLKFNWFLFCVAEFIILSGIGEYWKRNVKRVRSKKDSF